MNRVLLIWEEVPEDMKLYYLVDLTDIEYAKLLQCHNAFVNQSNLTVAQDEAVTWLNEWLMEREKDLVNKNSPFIIHDIDSVTIISSGFIL